MSTPFAILCSSRQAGYLGAVTAAAKDEPPMSEIGAYAFASQASTGELIRLAHKQWERDEVYPLRAEIQRLKDRLARYECQLCPVTCDPLDHDPHECEGIEQRNVDPPDREVWDIR